MPAVPRPYQLAGTRWELRICAACCAGLIAVFLADVLTPPDVILSALAVFPIVLAVWTLSTWPAFGVALTAGVLLALEAMLGSANWVTIAVEIMAYTGLAGMTRLFARRMTSPAALPQEPASGRRLDVLTRREREVIALAAHGRTASEIADFLHIGERTVETHLAHAYPKLGVRSKLELVKEARNLGV